MSYGQLGAVQLPPPKRIAKAWASGIRASWRSISRARGDTFDFTLRRVGRRSAAESAQPSFIVELVAKHRVRVIRANCLCNGGACDTTFLMSLAPVRMSYGKIYAAQY